MKISEIINQIAMVISNLLLTISIVYMVSVKMIDNSSVNIPIPAISLLLVYVFIYLLSFIIIGRINLVFILFYIIIFICLIILLILSYDGDSFIDRIKSISMNVKSKLQVN